MALAQDLETPAGIVCQYWRIGEYRVVFSHVGWSRVYVSLLGFLTAEKRAAGKDPFDSRTIEIEVGEVSDENGGISRASIYAWIKTNGDFLDAADV